MSKLLKNSMFYTLGNIIPKVTKFLLLPLYSIYMSPTDYGIVSAMMALQLVLLIFFTLSADRGVERIFYDDDDARRRNRLKKSPRKKSSWTAANTRNSSTSIQIKTASCLMNCSTGI